MSERIKIELTAAQRRELEAMRDRQKLPYLRERASAILKIAEGQTPHQVALHGLLKPRDPDTVYEWVERYRADGVAGLRIKQGRGRKPAFSPSAAGRRQR